MGPRFSTEKELREGLIQTGGRRPVSQKVSFRGRLDRKEVEWLGWGKPKQDSHPGTISTLRGHSSKSRTWVQGSQEQSHLPSLGMRWQLGQSPSMPTPASLILPAWEQKSKAELKGVGNSPSAGSGRDSGTICPMVSSPPFFWSRLILRRVSKILEIDS